MVQTAQINPEKIEEILSTLKEVKRELKEVKETLDREPPYGSDAWWNWSDRRAMEDFAAGRYKTFRTNREFKAYLDGLK